MSAGEIWAHHGTEYFGEHCCKSSIYHVDLNDGGALSGALDLTKDAFVFFSHE